MSDFVKVSGEETRELSRADMLEELYRRLEMRCRWPSVDNYDIFCLRKVLCGDWPSCQTHDGAIYSGGYHG